MTRRLRVAAEAVEIVLHDHIIIGHSTHTSFRTLGLL
jgi:DNA repair protein RadC